MERDNQISTDDKPTTEAAEQTGEAGTEESEFKLTVKKLEIPVRPRGVLAE
jgi:hypothetical protein